MASGYINGGYPKGSPHDWNPNIHPKTTTTTVVVPSDPFKALHGLLDPWTVGFDRHLQLMQSLEDVRIKSTYPPYNIKTMPDDKAEIELAIAGFKKEDVSITYKENILTVEGNRGEDDGEYSYKGIAARNFTQKFAIADDVIVNGAKLEDGFLTVSLERIVPEEKRSKKIKID
jgi:molecular chaperone IbpA